MLGWLDRPDFDEARQRAPAFAEWMYYSEFIAERDLLYIGYGAAGVRAEIQRVSFQAFERWARLTGAPLGLDGLDEFAAHWRWRKLHPTAGVSGRFGVPGDPERHSVSCADVECVRIRPELFEHWCADFIRSRLFDAPDLDSYAAYVVELSLVPNSRAEELGVNSPWPSCEALDERPNRARRS